jgi:putative oxidoreductase
MGSAEGRSSQRAQELQEPCFASSAVVNHPILERFPGMLPEHNRLIGRARSRGQIPIQIEEKSMKIASLISRYLLAVIFLVFGMNHYLNFIPTGPMPTGIAGQFFGAFLASHYMYVVAFFEVVPAILLLINRYVPLALVTLGPIIVNILITQILMAPNTIAVGAVTAILWFLAAWRVRSVFFPLLRQRVAD